MTNTLTIFSWNENSADIGHNESSRCGYPRTQLDTRNKSIVQLRKIIVHSECCRRNIWESTAIILRYEWIQHLFRTPINKSLWFMERMSWQWFGVWDGYHERSEAPPLHFQGKHTRYSRQRKTSLNIENPNNHLRFTIDWPFSHNTGFLLSSSQKIQSDVAGYHIHHKRNEQRWQFWVLATRSELVSDVCNIQRILQVIDIIIRITKHQDNVFVLWVRRKKLREPFKDHLLDHIQGTRERAEYQSRFYDCQTVRMNDSFKGSVFLSVIHETSWNLGT